MSSDYLPILIQILIAGGFAAVTLLISVVLGKSRPALGGERFRL